MKKVEMAELRVVEAGLKLNGFKFGASLSSIIDKENAAYGAATGGHLFKNSIRLYIPFFGTLVIGCTTLGTVTTYGVGLLGKRLYTDDDGSSVATMPLFAYFFECNSPT